jgi:hypothetical protein
MFGVLTYLLVNFQIVSVLQSWHVMVQLVEALRYKPEGRGINS